LETVVHKQGIVLYHIPHVPPRFAPAQQLSEYNSEKPMFLPEWHKTQKFVCFS